jgi:FkbM family methyltransferase
MDHHDTVVRPTHGIATLFVKFFQALRGITVITNKRQALQHLIFGHVSNLSLKEDGIKYKLTNGLIFKESNTKRDRTLFVTLQEIFVDDMYAFPMNKNAADKELVILDLGANVGAYSLYCCTRYKIAKILAFEPDPAIFDKLNANIHLNGLNDKIQTFQKVVSAEDGSIPFNIDSESSRGSSAMRKFKDSVTVPSVSLATIFRENNLSYCDIAKIDIEGSEYEVLFNCPKDILSSLGVILVECHEGFTPLNATYTKKSVRKFLEDNNFAILRDHDLMLVAENQVKITG